MEHSATLSAFSHSPIQESIFPQGVVESFENYAQTPRSQDIEKIAFSALEVEAEEVIRFVKQQPVKPYKRNVTKSHPFWTKEKNEYFVSLVKTYDHNWDKISKLMSKKFSGFTKSGKRCSDYWENSARPGLNRDPWTQKETLLLAEKFRELGRNWVSYKVDFPDRSQNALKNRWNSLQRQIRVRKKKPTQDMADSSPETQVSRGNSTSYSSELALQIIKHEEIPMNTAPCLTTFRITEPLALCSAVDSSDSFFQPGLVVSGSSVCEDRVTHYTKRKFEEKESEPVGKKRKTDSGMRKTNKATHNWTKQETDLLCKLVQKHGHGWRLIATKISKTMGVSLTDYQCSGHWNKMQRPEIKLGRWSEDEKVLFKKKFAEFGTAWNKYQHDFPGRTARAIQRQHNQLMIQIAQEVLSDSQSVDQYVSISSNPLPDPKKLHGNFWTKEEDELLIKNFSKLKTAWSKYKKLLPDRTTAAIRNRWKALQLHYSKQVISDNESIVLSLRADSSNNHSDFSPIPRLESPPSFSPIPELVGESTPLARPAIPVDPPAEVSETSEIAASHFHVQASIHEDLIADLPVLKRGVSDTGEFDISKYLA